MTFLRPVQWYHSHAFSLWPDSTFKFFDADPDPGSGIPYGKFGSGIRDKHAGSATLPGPTVSRFMFFVKGATMKSGSYIGPILIINILDLVIFSF